MKSVLIIICTVVLSIGNIFAQENAKDSIKSFSLKEAIDYAVKNSFNVQIAEIDVLISKQKIWETTAAGLPQIGATASYQDMLDIPTTLMPDFISPLVYGVLMKNGVKDRNGNPIMMPMGDMATFPAQFGTQHNANAKLSVSQLLFNGAYIVGLQASKVYHQFSTQALIKSQNDIKEIVTNLYLNLVISKENIAAYDSLYATASRMAFEAEAAYKLGLIEETDVEQFKLNMINAYNNLNNFKVQSDLARKILLIQMGIDINKELILTDNIESIINQTKLDVLNDNAFDINSNIDFQVLSTQESIAKLNLKLQKSTFLPSLVGFYSYQKSAMRNEFNIFDFSQKWYPTSVVGINIDIPIFSSGLRYSKVQQAKLSLSKAQLQKNLYSQFILTDYQQAKINYNSAIDRYNSTKEAYQIADKIYKKTMIKYKNGISTSNELTQIQNQYFNTTYGYYNSVFGLLSAKAKLDKILFKN